MKIRHIATSADGLRVALGAFDRRVEVWDLRTRSRISEFDTILDFGGSRLALNRDGSVLIAAAWEAGEVASYDAERGEELWRRPDLKRTQYITASSRADIVHVCREDGPACSLHSRTGESVSTYRGVRNIIESPYAALLLLDKAKPCVAAMGSLKSLFPIQRTTFAFLCAAFSPNEIAVSEAGGPVRCLSLQDGRVVWTFAPPEGVHCLDLMHSSNEGTFYGVLWSYADGGDQELVKFRENGTCVLIAKLGESKRTRFAAASDTIIGSDHRVLSVPNGVPIGTLATGEADTRH